MFFLPVKLKNYKNSMSQTDSTYYEKMKIYLYLLQIIQCYNFYQYSLLHVFVSSVQYTFNYSCNFIQRQFSFFYDNQYPPIP